MRPKLSILLPVKDVPADYLDEALKSLLWQTFEDWELLILDAGAPESWQHPVTDSRFRYVPQSPTYSLTEQLNHGLELCRSGVVARADGDDINEPGRLKEQWEWLRLHAEIAVLGTTVTLMNAGGELLGVRHYPESCEEIRRAMRRYNAVAHPTVMFRRDAVLQSGGYGFTGRPAQDYELWSRMLTTGFRFANLETAAVRYRLHANSVKGRRLRETLRSTRDVKTAYWRREMTPLDIGRLWLEQAAGYLPGSILQSLFVLMTAGSCEQSRHYQV